MNSGLLFPYCLRISSFYPIRFVLRNGSSRVPLRDQTHELTTHTRPLYGRNELGSAGCLASPCSSLKDRSFTCNTRLKGCRRHLENESIEGREQIRKLASFLDFFFFCCAAKKKENIDSSRPCLGFSPNADLSRSPASVPAIKRSPSSSHPAKYKN